MHAPHSTVRPILEFPFPTPPEPGRAVEIAPGIRWIRMPLPYRLDHVNLYALEESDGGLALIDTGIGTAITLDLWNELLSGDLAGRPIRRVIVTHFHPDHIGAAGWLVERSGARFHATRTEWLYARMLSLEVGEGASEVWARWYRRHGVPEAQIEKLCGSGGYYARAVKPIPAVYHRLQHEQLLSIDGRSWRVTTHGGHAPEQAVFDCEADRLFISADQVLPQISPNVSVTPAEPFGDPLAEYLYSLDAIAALPEDMLVLPMHGLPFRGLHKRLTYLKQHHAERLALLQDLARKPTTITEITRGMFHRELDLQQFGFAIGEALSHVNYLVARGQLAREESADGVDHYVTC